MVPRNALQVIDNFLQLLMDSNKPFGGKLLLLGGDFCQTLPVLKYGTASQQIDLSIKFSPLWAHFHIVHLTKNERADPTARQFAKEMRLIGMGLANGEG